MNLDDIRTRYTKQQRIDSLNEIIDELLYFFKIATNVSQINLYIYNYEYDIFVYESSFDDGVKSLKEIDIDVDNRKQTFLTKDEAIYGRLDYDLGFETTIIVENIFSSLTNKIIEKLELEKSIDGDLNRFVIYIIYDDGSALFLEQVKNDLKAVFHIDIVILKSLEEYMGVASSKRSRDILLYLISSQDALIKDDNYLKDLNDFIIVIGPDDYQTALLCGSSKIDYYFDRSGYSIDIIKELIINTRNILLNKVTQENKIVSFSGISGGMGTTTFAMNFANILSKELLSSNILFIDLSTTKGITNLFLDQNPLPKYSIIDLIKSGKFNIEKNLSNGLVKVSKNFYAINGIQKHIDQEYFDNDSFIGDFLDYISKASEFFNYIVIDAGVADASILKSTVYDISNDIWILTEMTLPHISKLQTFFYLVKRAGLQDKVSILVNRFDSHNALSIDDVSSILNISKDNQELFDYKIPNDYMLLGECWNQCELASNIAKDSTYIKSVKNIMSRKGYIDIVDSKSSSSFLSTIFKTKSKS
jgi:Flp pilus assembly CpaE family ATPase